MREAPSSVTSSMLESWKKRKMERLLISADAKDYPGFIAIPEDVKPIGAKSAWPDLTSGGLSPELLQDTDGDGMPDWWERKNGLDPNNASDGKDVTLCKTGYTNLEVYLNGLVETITQKQNHIANYAKNAL